MSSWGSEGAAANPTILSGPQVYTINVRNSFNFTTSTTGVVGCFPDTSDSSDFSRILHNPDLLAIGDTIIFNLLSIKPNVPCVGAIVQKGEGEGEAKPVFEFTSFNGSNSYIFKASDLDKSFLLITGEFLDERSPSPSHTSPRPLMKIGKSPGPINPLAKLTDATGAGGGGSEVSYLFDFTNLNFLSNSIGLSSTGSALQALETSPTFLKVGDSITFVAFGYDYYEYCIFLENRGTGRKEALLSTPSSCLTSPGRCQGIVSSAYTFLPSDLSVEYVLNVIYTLSAPTTTSLIPPINQSNIYPLLLDSLGTDQILQMEQFNQYTLTIMQSSKTTSTPLTGSFTVVNVQPSLDASVPTTTVKPVGETSVEGEKQISSLSSSSSLSSATVTQGVVQLGITTGKGETLSIATTLIFEFLTLLFGYVPSLIYRILSSTISLSVTLDFWGGLYLTLILTLGLIIIIRYRVLNHFARLQPVSGQNTRNAFDLKPDSTIENESRIPGYPDEFMNAFLNSIKVFGYLDRPVFHELSKNLQTRKLKAGQLLFDDGDCMPNDLDFYVVVEGKVQVFIKDANSGKNPNVGLGIYNDTPSSSSNEESGWNGNHLLNEVRSGGTVSSLFSILAILSEDLDLPLPLVPTPPVSTQPSPSSEIIPPFNMNAGGGHSSYLAANPSSGNGNLRVNTQVPSSAASNSSSTRSQETTRADIVNVGDITPSGTQPANSLAGSPLPIDERNLEDTFRSPLDKIENLDSSSAFSTQPSEFQQQEKSRAYLHEQQKLLFSKMGSRSVHPNLVARAATNVTLAVIPASSFRNLAIKFPKAASHMVNVILTRFQRVTFLTLQRYLGLSRELLEIERKVNEIAGSGLPPHQFPHQIVEACAWRLSHQYEEPDDFSKAAGTPKRQASSERVKSRMGSDGFGDDFSGGRGGAFLAGDLDEQLRESVFTCIAQLIGLTPSKEQVVPGASSAGGAGNSPSGSQIGQNIERFYYSTRRTSSVHSSTTSRRSMHFEDDLISVTSSHPDSLNDTHSDGSEETPEVDLLFFKQGKTILVEGEKCAGLYFVLDGTLEASTVSKRSGTTGGNNSSPYKSKKALFLIQPGGLAGYLSCLTGNASFVSLTAKTDVLVGLMPKSVVDRYVDKYPNVLLCLAKRLVLQLSPLVFHIDVALEWGQVNAGQVLCRQGEPSHSIFIVLTGRLRSIKERASAKLDSSANPSLEIQGEFGQSESVGELEVLIDSPRTSTIHAIRDSEIAIMPKTLFNALALTHPEIMMTISRMIATRSGKASKSYNSGSNNINLRTVALVPVSNETPIMDFAERLHESLSGMGVSSGLIQTRNIMNHLGRHAFTRLGRLKLMSWLHDLEETHRIVLYVADGGVTAPWTQRCIRQADCVLLVGLQEGDPSIGEYEQLLLSMKTTARKELVLLNSHRSCPTGSTAAWLKLRLWVHAHHHIQMPLPSLGLSFEKQKPKQMTFGNLGAHFQKLYSSQSSSSRLANASSASTNIHTGHRSDFSRLARRLLSKSIGLVLGGGGARGISHVGAIRALEEAGIPIDMIGGTSIGSFVGGLYARENDHVSVYGRCKSMSTAISSTWRTILDLTYPFASMTTGNEFNRGIWKAFGDTQIEDCWIPYFAVTTNITFSREETHQHGYIWRYVRASMSLSGYLPPLCDNGSMLMDGGYLNNVPADVMQTLGAAVIIAIDVGGSYSTLPVTYGDALSGWWVVLNRWNPFGKNYGQIPALSEIQGRLAYASSVTKLEEIIKIEGVHYLTPPVQKYGIMEFTKFSEVEQVGYEYMKKMLAKWNEDGTLWEQFGVKLEGKGGINYSSGRRASI